MELVEIYFQKVLKKSFGDGQRVANAKIKHFGAISMGSDIYHKVSIGLPEEIIGFIYLCVDR